MWMGAVRMRVQTADNNITIIHNTPVHQLMSWEHKRKKYFNFKLLLKYESIIHNASCSKKINKLQSHLVWIRREICIYKPKQFWTNTWVDFVVGYNRRWIFSLRKHHYGLYFGQKEQFECKNVLMMDLFLTNMQFLASPDVNWWTGVVWIIVMFYQLFGLSFWRHPFTSIGEQVMEWCISPNLMKKPTHLNRRWPESE